MMIGRLRVTLALPPRVVMLLTAIALCRAGIAPAAPLAAKCEASKLLASGKRALCLFKGQAKTVLGKTIDTTPCGTKFTASFSKAETAFGAECPTAGDSARIGGL